MAPRDLSAAAQAVLEESSELMVDLVTLAELVRLARECAEREQWAQAMTAAWAVSRAVNGDIPRAVNELVLAIERGAAAAGIELDPDAIEVSSC